MELFINHSFQGSECSVSSSTSVTPTIISYQQLGCFSVDIGLLDYLSIKINIGIDIALIGVFGYQDIRDCRLNGSEFTLDVTTPVYENVL